MWKRFFIGILFFLIGLGSSNGQGLGNPFELEYRMPKPTKVAVPKPSDNPFDVTREAPNAAARKAEEVAPELPPEPVLSQEEAQQGFHFWVVTGMLVCLALLATLYKTFIGRAYRAFMNQNILRMIHREQNAVAAFPYLLLYGLFFVNAGLCIYLIAVHYGYLAVSGLSLAYCIGGLIVIFAGKHALLKIVAYIFPIGRELRFYSFMIIIFSIMLGLGLGPINVLLAFGPSNLVPTFKAVALGIVLFIYAFRSLRSLFMVGKYITFYKFHFFMYLCTVEIAPALILAKLILVQAGSQ